jgi:hypothetical protein
MTTEQQVRILANITTRDERGRHFTTRFADESLRLLESLGLLAIHRPTHDATGIPYDRHEWSVEVTDAGRELVEVYPEFHADDDNA